jgi:hypothetical protein
MPNDFEKQVRQKMDELDFVPGEPVWTKIEEQIRGKKEKKRMILWLPLAGLLLVGGGLWLDLSGGEDQKKLSHNENATHAPVSEAQKSGPASNPASTTSTPASADTQREQQIISVDAHESPNSINASATNSFSRDVNRNKSVKTASRKQYQPSTTGRTETTKNEPLSETQTKET